MMLPSTAARPDVVQALEDTAGWGRPEPAGPRDGGAVVDRADELYLRTRRLEEQVGTPGLCCWVLESRAFAARAAF
jgi:hypothetical protein